MRHLVLRACLPVPPPTPQSTQHKLETEVLAPLHRWQEVYMQLGVRAWPWLVNMMQFETPVLPPAMSHAHSMRAVRAGGCEGSCVPLLLRMTRRLCGWCQGRRRRCVAYAQ